MIRIEFEKKGTAIYLSHLDLMRAMTRALTRAEVPVKFTEGFNPHPYLVFAAPLALGIAGEKEYFEIKLTRETAPEEIKERLNAALPAGLRILGAEETNVDFNVIEQAEYILFTEGKTANDWDAFFAAPSIPAEKKTKRGMETVDLKQEILSAQAQDVPGGVQILLRLPCGNRRNLSPLLVEKVFAPDPEIYYTVCRTCFFDENGNVF